MQVQAIQSNQNFGMSLSISKSAQTAIGKRINESEIENLTKLTKSQINNKFGVNIDLKGERELKGYVADGMTYYKSFEEGFIASLFDTPIKFIQKLCNDADKQLKESQKLQKIFEAVNGKTQI